MRPEQQIPSQNDPLRISLEFCFVTRELHEFSKPHERVRMNSGTPFLSDYYTPTELSKGVRPGSSVNSEHSARANESANLGSPLPTAMTTLEDSK
ncbi:hypothetical protein SK128_014557 [Halocaridina rubra]|uniref:Uncharacterized protein n=1 Tax=Halocaridina rubra TaxID=373956 RepID=A0AAN9A4X6_HALRR